MESSLKNMVLTLLVITLAAAGALGLVYNLTKGPIEASKSAKTLDAISAVLPPFDNDPASDTVTMTIDGLPVKVYRAKKDGEITGYAVESVTMKGFSGEIRLMVGFGSDGEIINIKVLQHNETPGLGSKMADPDNVLLLSFRGRNAADMEMKVTSDGGDVDVITASTISSRAYADAVERAYRAYLSERGEEITQEQPVNVFEKVLPPHDNDPGKEAFQVAAGKTAAQVFTGKKRGIVTGYAVESSAEGFDGDIAMMVGFTPEGIIHGIYVTRQQETPGFGAAIAEEGNSLATSFIGKDPATLKFELKDNGGDIDALSGSTVTSAAYTEAVGKAYAIFLNIGKEVGDDK